MWFKSNFTTPAVAAISFCLIGGTTPAYADLGDQLAKLLPDDGAEFDQFGNSVAISRKRQRVWDTASPHIRESRQCSCAEDDANLNCVQVRKPLLKP